MRLLIVSETGHNLGYVSHLEREGHAVETLIGTQALGNLPISTCNIAIFDSPNHSTMKEELTKRGVRSLGVSAWGRMIELNPEYRQDLIGAIGYTKPTEKLKPIDDVTVCCWFNGHKFISKFVVFNYTKILAGDLGVDVRSAGYLAHFGVDKSPLVESILTPLERFLRKANHKGCFSVKCKIDKDGAVYVYDIDASLATPYAQAIYENTSTNKGDIILSVIDENSKPIKYLDPWACGIMVSTYPYPYSVPKLPVSIIGINQGNLKHSWFMDLAKRSEQWVCGQLSGCLGYVTARGTSPQESVRRAYRTLSNISMDDMQYRNDIGKGIYNRVSQLHKLNLL